MLTSQDVYRNTQLNTRMYWKEKLSRLQNETTILNDFRRPLPWVDDSTRMKFNLSDSVSENILKISNGSDFAVFIILASLVIELLRKYNSNNDLTIGIPIYPVLDEQSHSIIPLVLHLEKNSVFKDDLLKIRASICEAYCHRDISLEALADLAGMDREENRCPIFDIFVALDNIHGKTTIKNFKNDLAFIFHKSQAGIDLNIEYNSALYRPSSIHCLGQHLLAISSRIMEDINSVVDDISLLSEQEALSISQFSITKDFGTHRSITAIFEEQVNKTPDFIACEFRNNRVTYQELNERANKLARFLVELKVGEGKYVAILEERNINFLISMLAILKTGAAFVPIDTFSPEERIRYIISNSEVSTVLTNSRILTGIKSVFVDNSRLDTVICLDTLDQRAAGIFKDTNIRLFSAADFQNQPPDNLDNHVLSSNPAYMIYTSGTTGAPKGAIVRQDGMLNHIFAEIDSLGIHDHINFLQSASASTDIFIWQYFTGILLGGKTTVIDYDDFCNPEVLFQFLEIKQITLMEIVPSLFSIFVNFLKNLPGEKLILSHLKYIVTTGEAVSSQLVNDWFGLFPDIRIANAYGPTEASDDVTQYIINSALPENLMRVPIGKPLANISVYIFDQKMQLLPVGIVGEIGVSGIGVGNGYWQNNEMTIKHFVENPFDKNRGKILYKTGDMGRWLPGGDVELLGRKDYQVKIRGYRVELEEIKSQLLKFPEIQDALVIIQTNTRGEKGLYAYVVSKPDGVKESASLYEFNTELKNRLRKIFPEYMIPLSIMQIDKIPLMLNGKVDLKMLPSPQFQTGGIFAPPQNDTERQMIDIWASVLNIDKTTISIDANFFDLGGNSLNLITVKSEIKKLFDRDISIIDLFKHVCIRELSNLIRTPEDIASRVLKDELIEESAYTMGETIRLLDGDANA